jgi:hypothetical protein
VHWFNSVRVSRLAIEAYLGPAKLDQRARQYYILGASLAALFDIATAPEFLKALSKLLDDWESWVEGRDNKGVVRDVLYMARFPCRDA